MLVVIGGGAIWDLTPYLANWPAMRAIRMTGLLAPVQRGQRTLPPLNVDIHTPDQNQAHLQEKLDFGFDHVLVAVVEKLGAVTCIDEIRKIKSEEVLLDVPPCKTKALPRATFFKLFLRLLI
jgi:hypothetical protein